MRRPHCDTVGLSKLKPVRTCSRHNQLAIGVSLPTGPSVGRGFALALLAARRPAPRPATDFRRTAGRRTTGKSINCYPNVTVLAADTLAGPAAG